MKILSCLAFAGLIVMGIFVIETEVHAQLPGDCDVSIGSGGCEGIFPSGDDDDDDDDGHGGSADDSGNNSEPMPPDCYELGQALDACLHYCYTEDEDPMCPDMCVNSLYDPFCPWLWTTT